MRLTEAGDMPAECFDRKTNRCTLAGRCRLQGALREAVDTFYATLSRYTLADIGLGTLLQEPGKRAGNRR